MFSYRLPAPSNPRPPRGLPFGRPGIACKWKTFNFALLDPSSWTVQRIMRRSASCYHSVRSELQILHLSTLHQTTPPILTRSCGHLQGTS